MMFKLTAIYFNTSKVNVINKFVGQLSLRYVEYGWIDGTRLIEKVLYAHDYVINHISGVHRESGGIVMKAISLLVFVRCM